MSPSIGSPARVAAGGHPVPETKIRERYQRLWPLVADAVGRADAAMIFDNSGTRMAPIARFRNGFIVSLDHGWPEWTPAAIRDNRCPRRRLPHASAEQDHAVFDGRRLDAVRTDRLARSALDCHDLPLVLVEAEIIGSAAGDRMDDRRA